MSEEIFVAVLSLAGTLAGSLCGILAANRMTVYRIEQLEKKVDKHNSVVERTGAYDRSGARYPRFEERMRRMTQNRLKSWALWTALAALAVFCVKEFAGVDIQPTVDGLLDALLPVLVGFGIINDPTSHDHL